MNVFITSSWMKQQQFWMDRANFGRYGTEAQ